MIVEKISEEEKNLDLLKRISELERVIGRKQLEIDFYKTTIEILNEEEGEDILKKYRPKSWQEYEYKDIASARYVSMLE